MKYSELPRALRDVASLNIFVGAVAILESLLAARTGGVFDFSGVFTILLGYGFLRLNRFARTVQLIGLWALFIGLPGAALAALSYLFREGNLDRVIPGDPATWQVIAGGLAVGVTYGLGIWQYRVLTRPEIRALFGLDTGMVNFPARKTRV